MCELVRVQQNEYEAVQAFQHAAYDGNRMPGISEPLPLLANYAEILTTHEVWLAQRSSEILGVLVLLPRSDDLLIWSVATAPAMRGNGVGNRLLLWAEQRANELSLRIVRLYTRDSNCVQIEWYKRRGFAVERIEKLNDRRLVHMMKNVEEAHGRLKGIS